MDALLPSEAVCNGFVNRRAAKQQCFARFEFNRWLRSFGLERGLLLGAEVHQLRRTLDDDTSMKWAAALVENAQDRLCEPIETGNRHGGSEWTCIEPISSRHLPKPVAQWKPQEHWRWCRDSPGGY